MKYFSGANWENEQGDLRTGNNMKEKGFTLIELLVVIAIIGLLASVGISIYNFKKFEEGLSEKAEYYAVKDLPANCLKYFK